MREKSLKIAVYETHEENKTEGKVMRKCIVAPDSFKGSLSSLEICRLTEQCVHTVFPDCEVISLPVADGGEGTVDCFLKAVGGNRISLSVQGPLGDPVEAAYGRIGDTAVIELAQAAGLPLVEGRADPARTSTFGVGELMAHAIDHGAKHLILGLGGSATNDGGCGCAAALGAAFRDSEGRLFVPVGGTLERVAHIDLSAVAKKLQKVHITLMSDVENPFFGPNGAAFVFGPQKGADAAMVRRLDDGLRRLSDVMEKDLGLSVALTPGAGSAGGLGGGGIAFLGGEMKSGIESVLDALDFDRFLPGTDLVITGEGRVDSQSLQGKVISGLLRRTVPLGIPLLVIAGAIDQSAAAAYEKGVTAMFSTDRRALGYPEVLADCEADYRATLEDVLRFARALEK